MAMPGIDRWKTTLTALATVAGALWFSVTWADDKLRKIEKVPQLERAVDELTESVDRLTEVQTRLVRQQQMADERQAAQNAAILNRLDKLLENGGRS